MTCPSDNVLAELVDGSLAERDRAAVEQHLDTCTTCDQLVAELAWVLGSARPAPAGYWFTRILGDGVFEAIELASDRPVVVELGTVDRRLATLRHPAIAPVYAIGDDHVVTARLDTSAREWCAGRSSAEIVALWCTMLDGLAVLHRAGLAHGGLSPDHVFVVDGRPVIGGFARPLARTSGYLAAERLEGAAPSPAADQVAACISLYELLAGHRPFTGATPGALAVAMSSAPDPTGIDREVYRVLERGMALDPARRWPEVAALAAALANPPRLPRVAIAMIAVAAIAIVAYLAIR